MTLQTQKYKVIPFSVQAEIKDAVEKSMITISEALLARALLSKNAAADVICSADPIGKSEGWASTCT